MNETTTVVDQKKPIDKTLMVLAFLSQLVGLVAIAGELFHSPERVVVWEGASIGFATFFLGFTSKKMAWGWNVLFGVVNALIVWASWHFTNR